MLREDHGDYWLVVVQYSAGPQSVWEWKVYRQPTSRAIAVDRAGSEHDARDEARRWIERAQAGS
jgi:hypothetical protein